jgi:hypothetical protein
MRDSSSGQEEGTVLSISMAQIEQMRTCDVSLHGPVKLLSGNVGNAGLIVLRISPIIKWKRKDLP